VIAGFTDIYIPLYVLTDNHNRPYTDVKDWIYTLGQWFAHLKVTGRKRKNAFKLACCFSTGTKGGIYAQAGCGKGVAAILKLRVRARGDRFEVWLNGTKTTDYTNASYPGVAPLGLQVPPASRYPFSSKTLS
jgi:hypothetical protein